VLPAALEERLRHDSGGSAGEELDGMMRRSSERRMSVYVESAVVLN